MCVCGCMPITPQAARLLATAAVCVCVHQCVLCLCGQHHRHPQRVNNNDVSHIRPQIQPADEAFVQAA